MTRTGISASPGPLAGACLNCSRTESMGWVGSGLVDRQPAPRAMARRDKSKTREFMDGTVMNSSPASTKVLWRRRPFQRFQRGTHLGSDAGADEVENQGEAQENQEQQEKAPEMPGFKTFDRPGECHQAEHGRHDDNRIDADALPITAAQMQPHSKFIKGQSQGDAVEQGDGFGGAAVGAPKNAVACDRDEQDDAVIQ